ncbi:hypothetical protein D3C75_160020 [compost metagenome]
MAEPRSYSMKFMDSVLGIDVDTECIPLMENIFRFFTTHLSLTPGRPASAEASVFVHSYAELNIKNLEWEEVLIRRNKYPEFHLYGLRGLPEAGKEMILSEHTGTAILFEEHHRRIHLYISERSYIQVIDLIRDLFIRLEEYRGTLVLHASAASDGEKIIAVVGRKGAGKSTFLLELLVDHQYKFVSGDKLFLRINDGEIQAYGWPDYPSLGFGTILKYPRLAEMLKAEGYELDPAKPEAKILFSPHLLEKVFDFQFIAGPMPLQAVLLPDVLASEETGVIQESDPRLVTEHVEITANNPLNGWNHFIKPASSDVMLPKIQQLSDALSTCRMVSVRGKGILDSELLSRITDSSARALV